MTRRTFIGSLSIFALLLCLHRPLLADDDGHAAILEQAQKAFVEIHYYDGQGTRFATGSGLFLSEDGDVLTHWQPLLQATRIEAKSSNGNTYPVTGVVRENREADLARLSLEIPRSEVPQAKWATSGQRKTKKLC
jgi:hypothetical protein